MWHLLWICMLWLSVDSEALCVFLFRRDLRNLLPPASTMNVFDRNINIDALFTFSQMYVSSVHALQRLPCGVLAFSRFTADCVADLSPRSSIWRMCTPAWHCACLWPPPAPTSTWSPASFRWSSARQHNSTHSTSVNMSNSATANKHPAPLLTPRHVSCLVLLLLISWFNTQSQHFCGCTWISCSAYSRRTCKTAALICMKLSQKTRKMKDLHVTQLRPTSQLRVMLGDRICLITITMFSLSYLITAHRRRRTSSSMLQQSLTSVFFALTNRGGCCLPSAPWPWWSGSAWRLTALRRSARDWPSSLASPSSQVQRRWWWLWWWCYCCVASVIMVLLLSLHRPGPGPDHGLCHHCQSQVRVKWGRGRGLTGADVCQMLKCVCLVSSASLWRPLWGPRWSSSASRSVLSTLNAAAICFLEVQHLTPHTHFLFES